MIGRLLDDDIACLHVDDRVVQHHVNLAVHVQGTPIPPSQRTELPIPRELDALVLACLEKDPARRPQDASAVLEALGRCRTADTWDNTAARAWWERHLVELTDPLTASALETSLLLAS